MSSFTNIGDVTEKLKNWKWHANIEYDAIQTQESIMMVLLISLYTVVWIVYIDNGWGELINEI